MINLRRFDPKSLLTLNDFKLNNDGTGIFLNEKKEKVWSYTVTTDTTVINVVFQVVYDVNRFTICYNTDRYEEEIRYKASLLAHDVKKALSRMHPTIPSIFEAPIIHDLNAYEMNKQQDYTALYKTFVQEEFSFKDMDKTIIINLFGEDGKKLGNLISSHTNATFLTKADGEHELTVFSNELAESKELVELFLKKIHNKGFTANCPTLYSIDNHEVADLLEKGLIEVLQTSKN